MALPNGSVRQASDADVETARAVLQPLLDVLRLLSPPDQMQGQEAAGIIEGHLRPGTPLANFWSTLGYDIGGKGLQDWGWSQPALAAMQPVLDAANKVITAAQRSEIRTRNAG